MPPRKPPRVPKFRVRKAAGQGYVVLNGHARYLGRADDPATERRYHQRIAERQIRPAVILRKSSQSNRSNRGAVTQAVLMSVYRTLKLRGHDPLQTITQALRTYLQTGQLPPLPAPVAAHG